MGLMWVFFKKVWSIIGLDTINVVQSFFKSGRLLKQVNATFIALISKVPNLLRVKDFRLISCCNTIYEYIAKIITNRVKSVLLDLVRFSPPLLSGEISMTISYYHMSFFIIIIEERVLLGVLWRWIWWKLII